MTDEETYPTVPGDQGQPVPVPWLTGDAPNPRVAPVNRWAAFTDDELHDVWQILVAYPRGGPVGDEAANRFTDDVEVELERRKT